ncbi:DUF1476 domain-containing protein [Donghicola sp. C2-DW-16]|uniref:DUF1476 domain-containing protein n=1 Tax=Donghicola mangrovi TaxID=2729614 RepID=A0ABX2PG61_9RHOB|nr:ATPase inhibitor subunit zeta [Donghicola mangrovi]NVO28465.1 DUF1476 domain-containing protein [Donghicola mangrovi]
MGLFDDRERAYENLHAHEQEKTFLVSSLRSRMMAAWAADIMGKTGQDAEDYVRQVVHAEIADRNHTQHPNTLLDRLSEDLGAAISAATLNQKMALMTKEAQDRIERGN